MWERVILHKLGVGRPCERVHLYSFCYLVTKLTLLDQTLISVNITVKGRMTAIRRVHKRVFNFTNTD